MRKRLNNKDNNNKKHKSERGKARGQRSFDRPRG